MSKFKINKVTLYAANLIAVQLVFALAYMYEITLEQVFETFTKLNYWKVLNNTEICCILAHDGIKDTVSDVSKQFDTIFGTQLNAYKKMVIPFDSQSITIIEQIMKDKKKKVDLYFCYAWLLGIKLRIREKSKMDDRGL